MSSYIYILESFVLRHVTQLKKDAISRTIFYFASGYLCGLSTDYNGLIRHNKKWINKRILEIAVHFNTQCWFLECAMQNLHSTDTRYDNNGCRRGNDDMPDTDLNTLGLLVERLLVPPNRKPNMCIFYVGTFYCAIQLAWIRRQMRNES